MPSARPGPRWSSVSAGRPVMRAYPSAAPVHTPSNKPSTARMPGTTSSAPTSCISVVPGLAKHTSTPEATAVRIRPSAPFMSSGEPQVRRRGEAGDVDPERTRARARVMRARDARLRVPAQARVLALRERQVAVVLGVHARAQDVVDLHALRTRREAGPTTLSALRGTVARLVAREQLEVGAAHACGARRSEAFVVLFGGGHRDDQRGDVGGGQRPAERRLRKRVATALVGAQVGPTRAA